MSEFKFVSNDDAPKSEDHYLAGDPVRILFIRPPAQYPSLDWPDGPRIGLPLGILYLSGLFNSKMGIETEVLDAIIPTNLDDLKRQKPPFYCGIQIHEIVERAQAFKPTIVAVSANFSYFLGNAIATINAIREAMPEVFIVAGGSDVTAQPEAYLRGAKGLDVAAIGEGEIILKNLVGRIRNRMDWKKLPGLAYLSENVVVKTAPQGKIKDLDNYQIDYGKIDLEKYFEMYERGYPARLTYEYPHSHRAVSMVTSRGCPFKCVFCSIHLHMGHAFRWHSAENVIEHIRTLVDRYGVRHIHFEDDNLTLHKPRFKKILEGIIKNKFPLTWDTPNGVRADLLDEEMIRLCRKSGCVYLMFGVESGNQKVLDEIVKKDLDLNKLVESARLCHKEGIDTAAFYIFGFPGETRENIRETIDLAFDMFKKYKTRPHANIARPLMGTELYRTAKAMNVLIDTSIMDPEDRYEGPKTLIGPQMIETQEFSLEYLTSTFRRYQRGFIIQSLINLGWFASQHPLLFLRAIGSMLLDVAREPLKAKETILRYTLRKFIFPHSMARKDLYRNEPYIPVSRNTSEKIVVSDESDHELKKDAV